MSHSRTYYEVLVLAVLLPFVAGAVNAAGFFAVGSYTSHVSGSLARIGDELAGGTFKEALFFAFLIVCFFLGAAWCTLQIIAAHRKERARYVRPLLTQALTLSVYASSLLFFSHPSRLLLAGLLSLSMGLQNALVTKISGARVRTTHMTGIVTDIGIEAARLFQVLRRGPHSLPFAPADVQLPTSLTAQPDFQKLKLHLMLVGSFLSGAIAGPLGYVYLGPWTMFVPAVLLLVLAYFDARLGLTVQHGHLAWSEPNTDPHAHVLPR